MKKNILFILFFCVTVFAFGQNVSNYQYIHIPVKFKDFKTNEYNLNDLLKKALINKNYKIIGGDSENLNEEFKQKDPCEILTAELLNNSNMLRNKVILQLIDCKKNVVLESKAASYYKEFDLGFQDALSIALKSVPNSTQEGIKIASQQIEKKPEQTTSSAEKVQAAKPSSSISDSENKAEIYSNGKLNLQKIKISNEQFILVSSNSSMPFATFKNTTKKDVFRVQLENGTSTMGYYENGNITIEMPTNDGNYQIEVFEKK